MRHVFILNPAAGKKENATKLIPSIDAYFAKEGGDYTIRQTEYAGHATEIAREEATKGDPVRIYAVGGDGTLFEVTNGANGFDNAEITVIPCGSGNDYVKTYGSPEDFLDLPALINGTPKTVDAIQCGDVVSLNLCSLGMDADIGAGMNRFKRWPLVSGPFAYDLAVVNALLHPIGNYLKVIMETPDGTIEREGRYLFSLAANGQYYGGGYHGAPGAKPDDGLLDFVLINTVSRLKAITLVKGYKQGQHYDWDICEHLQGTKMHILCEKGACVNIDGEILHSTDVTFELLPKHFRFVIPATPHKETQSALKEL